MSASHPISLTDFHLALMAKNVKQKLEPYIDKFQATSIPTIYECLSYLIQLISDKSELPIMRFNALIAARYFFDTCEYPAVIIIEVFMLPLIEQIALKKNDKRSEKTTEFYFIDQGAQKTQQNRKLGLNFIEFASEFIFNCAKVKPYRLVENIQLKEESKFARSAKSLKSKGIKQPQNWIYYFPSYLAETRKKFLQKLRNFLPESYISFAISQILEDITQKKKCKLDLKILLLFGDSFLVSTIIEIIDEQLFKMSENFKNKRKFLSLIHELVKSGQIQSIYFVNTTDSLKQIAQEVSKIKGNLGLEQGQFIYPQICATNSEKKQFYVKFLEIISIWARCMPSTWNGRKSNAIKIYQELTMKKFVFPESENLSLLKAQMDQNLILNQQRNEMLMKIIDSTAIKNPSSYVSNKVESRVVNDRSKTSQFDELQYKVSLVRTAINEFGVQQGSLQNQIELLANFAENWPKHLKKMQSKNQDSRDILLLAHEGNTYYRYIERIFPIYDEYLKDKRSFPELSRKISALKQQLEKTYPTRKNSKFLRSVYGVQKNQQNQNPQEFDKYKLNLQNDKQYEKNYQNYGLEQQIPNEQGKADIKLAKVYYSKTQQIEPLTQDQVKQYQINARKKLQTQKFPQKKTSVSAVSPKNYKQFGYHFQNYDKSSAIERSLNFYDSPDQASASQDKKSSSSKLYKIQKPKGKSHLGTDNRNKSQQNKYQLYGQNFFGQNQSKQKKSNSSSYNLILKNSNYQPNQHYKVAELRNPQEKNLINDYEMRNVEAQSNTFKRIQVRKYQTLDQNDNYAQYEKSHFINSKILSVQRDSVSPFSKAKLSSNDEAIIKNLGYGSANHGKTECPAYELTVEDKTKNLGYQSNDSGRVRNSKIKPGNQVFSGNLGQEYSNGEKPKSPKYQYDNQVIVRNLSYQSGKKREDFEQNKLPNYKEMIVQTNIKRNTKNEFDRINPQKLSQYYDEGNETYQRLKIQRQQNNSSKSLTKIRLSEQTGLASRKVDAQMVEYGDEVRREDANIQNLHKKDSKSSFKPELKLIPSNDLKNIEPAFNYQEKPVHQIGLKKTQLLQRQPQISELAKLKELNLDANQKLSSRQKPISEDLDFNSNSRIRIKNQFQRIKDLEKIEKDPQLVSEIDEPQNLPTLQSCIDENETHSDFQKKNSQNYKDFQACCSSINRQILPLNETKKKAISDPFSLGKSKSVIQLSNLRSSGKINSVVDVISGQNAKNSIMLYKLEKEKARSICSKQEKLKNIQLSSFGVRTMQILKQDSNRLNIMSHVSSQRQFKLLSPNFKASQLNSMKSSSSSRLEFSKKPLKENQSQINQADYEYLNSLCQGKDFINSNASSQYFTSSYSHFSKENLHNLYNKKGLLVNNQQIEIGYMITKKQNSAIFSLFITPNRSAITNIDIDFTFDQNITVQPNSNHINFIQSAKQGMTACCFNVVHVPFKLPQAKISFDSNPNYKKNFYNLVLPCTILSFIEIAGGEHDPNFNYSDYRFSGQAALRTEVFKILRKLRKPEKLRQIFTGFNQVKREQRILRYEGLLKYQQSLFAVSIILNENGYAIIEGYQRKKQRKAQKYLQFILATMKYVLEDRGEFPNDIKQ